MITQHTPIISTRCTSFGMLLYCPFVVEVEGGGCGRSLAFKNLSRPPRQNASQPTCETQCHVS